MTKLMKKTSAEVNDFIKIIRAFKLLEQVIKLN